MSTANAKVPNAAPSNSSAIAANATKTVGKSSSSFKDMWNKGTDGFMSLMSDKGPLMIFIIAVILIFIIVIIYITFALKNANLKGKQLVKKPIKLDGLSSAIQISNADIPKPAVGREYTYSFWVYVDEFTQTNNNNKLLFYRGAKEGISGANPLVMMDGLENRLYFMIKTQDSSLPALVAGDLRPTVTGNFFKDTTSSTSNLNKYIIMEVDYVPVQRWVNIICVVDNKIITLFMDGEIYSVKTTDELKALRKPELNATGTPINYNLIVDKSDGDMFIGKNTINNNQTLNGYLSNVNFMNYAISLNQVKTTYNRGPLASGGAGNFLTNVGINYGVRSPLYKLNENIQA